MMSKDEAASVLAKHKFVRGVNKTDGLPPEQRAEIKNAIAVLRLHEQAEEAIKNGKTPPREFRK